MTLGISNINPAATHVHTLFSASPAPGGLGSGPVLGLVPDGLFVSLLYVPSAPFNLFHFPVTANPYAGGPLILGPGSASFLAGQTWEGVVFSYSFSSGIVELTNFVQLAW